MKEIIRAIELQQQKLQKAKDMLEQLGENAFITTKTFNEYSWEEIKKLVESGNHPFKVGDIKKIGFGYKEHEIVIIGVNHDGKNTITCQFRDIVFISGMNEKNTNKGGFKGSDLYDYLNGDFKKELTKIIPINENKYIFLPSEFEVFGEDKYSKKLFLEKQYEYYKDKRNRIKFEKENDFLRDWLLRSSVVDDTKPITFRSDVFGDNGGNNFLYVSSKGIIFHTIPTALRGIAPCFII